MKLAPIIFCGIAFGDYTVELTDDVFSLSQGGMNDRVAVELFDFLDWIKENQWTFEPVFPELASNYEACVLNDSREIPSSEPCDLETVYQMRKHNLHTFYRLQFSELTPSTDFSTVEEMWEVIAHFSNIVKGIGKVEAVVEETSETSENVIAGDGAEGIEGSGDEFDINSRAVKQPYSVCVASNTSFPCQSYLYDKGPPKYKSPGNHVTESWLGHLVYGEEVSVGIMLPGRIAKHAGMKVPVKVLGDASKKDKVFMKYPSNQKSAMAGIIAADESSSKITGIAYKLKQIYDIDNGTLTETVSQELVKVLKAGDILAVAWSYDPSTPGWEWITTDVSRETTIKLADISKYDSGCKKFGCAFPSVFNPFNRSILDYLADKGVATFVSGGDGGTDLDSAFFTELLLGSGGKWEQNVALVNTWNPLKDKPFDNTAYVRSNSSMINIQFTNWGSDVVTIDDKGGYDVSFGGSQAATAITSGVGALIQSAAVKYTGKPLSPSALFKLMQSTGKKVSNTSSDTKHMYFGNTRLPDAYAAIQKLVKDANGSGTLINPSKSTKTKAATTKKKATTTKKK